MLLKFLFVLVLLSSGLFAKEAKFSEFIDKQIALSLEMEDSNSTEDGIKKLLEKQEHDFSQIINRLMTKKHQYIANVNMYEKEIFALKKIISINTRAGNKLAVLRDKISLKSYLLVRAQNIMLKEILQALDLSTLEEFEERLNKSVSKNAATIEEIHSSDYEYILNEKASTSLMKKVQYNVREFKALYDLNSAIITHTYSFQTKMYRLNKYAKYHMIGLAIYINTHPSVKVLNPILEKYGLNVIKISIIFFLILTIYLFRKIAFVWMEKYILSIVSLQKYSKEILGKISKILELIVIIINIDMVIYVYNDFSSYEFITKIFDIIYVVLLTLLVYKLVNSIATIRLNDIQTQEKQVKNELINVGIKILNFIIFIIGLLTVLYFAGVNLTAVLSGLGIGGFAVAFAAKDTISNFFGTLSVLFSDVFSQGDWIEVDGAEGVVVEIGLRVTTIRTFDNALIAVPNGVFAAKEIKNWNKRILGRRIKMNIGVTYRSKSEDINNAVNEIREMLDKHPGVATRNTKFDRRKYRSAKIVSKNDLEGVKNNLLVYLDSFGDSSINILIYCFSKSVKWEEWLIVKEDVMHQIMRILEKNSLEFAFPSLSIYNENTDNHAD